MTRPRYPTYHRHARDGIAELPAHWPILPIKAVASHNDETLAEDEPRDAELMYLDISNVVAGKGIIGTEAMTFGTAPSRARRRVRDGDVIISTVRTYLRASAQIRSPDPRLVVSTGFAVLRPRHSLHPDFLAYLVNADFFVDNVIARSVGVSYPAINASDLVRIPVPVPPLAEQHAIAAFLDHETSAIDILVAEQERLVELLKEKRQAVISHAVTRGLNADAAMKSSGSEWLGDVPAHWRVSAVRRLVRQIEQGWSPDCLSRPAEIGEWGVLKSGCINRGIYDETDNKALPGSLEPLPALEVRVGDVLMSRASGSRDLIGSTAYISATRSRLMLSDKIFRLQPESDVDSVYLALLLNSRLMRSQVEVAISGAGGLANNLPQSEIKAFTCAVPPLGEQRAITHHVQTKAVAIDALIGAANSAIGLLHERRAAIVSAAVMGQIDVRPESMRTAA